MPGLTTVDSVLLVHGYSVRTLNCWGRLPALLQADGIHAQSLFLSAFVSLDDYVSCDDLAQGCEEQVSLLEAQGLDIRKTCIIAHSTGAIIARRWILNRRLAQQNKLPAYFISCAGANHGSTLSQLGRTELARLFRDLTDKTTVGKRVLEDLDYGSEFLRRLNRDWLSEWNSINPLYESIYCFSLGGTDHSFWQNHLIWQGHETGSDGTVRVSGANLNYRYISVRPPYTQDLNVETMLEPCPHLVVETPSKKYSHTNQSAIDALGLVMSSAADAASTISHAFGGQPEPISSIVYGILEGIQTPDERPYIALREAMGVQSVDDYKRVEQGWAIETSAWSSQHSSEANSGIVVAIADQRGRLVDDSLVLIRDQQGSVQNISQSILPNQPIRNAITPSVISFYVGTNRFEASHPHAVHVEAQTDTAYVSYGFSVDAALSGKDSVGNALHVIGPNEFTYVDILVERDATSTFVFYPMSFAGMGSILDRPYPPFLPGHVA